MSTGGETGAPRRRVPAWVTVIVVVVVVLLAGLVAVLTGRDQDPSQAGGSPSPTMPVPAPPEVSAATGLRVTAGAGGKGTAADGRTPIRYPKTCEGAVAAATNYYAAIRDALYTNTSAEELDALIEEVSAGIETGVRAEVQNLYSEIRTNLVGFDDATTAALLNDGNAFRPEWGGFRVVSCAEQNFAQIEVLGYTDMATATGPGGVPLSVADAAQISVQWHADDWRLVRLEEVPLDDYPPNTAGLAENPVPASTRRAWMAAAGNGWTEYTNAP